MYRHQSYAPRGFNPYNNGNMPFRGGFGGGFMGAHQGSRHASQLNEPALPLLKEIAQFNKVEPEFILLDLEDKARSMIFVRLRLSDAEIYEASGSTISEAQERAAFLALMNNTRLKWPANRRQRASSEERHKKDKSKTGKAKRVVNGTDGEMKSGSKSDGEPDEDTQVEPQEEEDTTVDAEGTVMAEVRTLAGKLNETVKVTFTKMPALHHPGAPPGSGRGMRGNYNNSASVGGFPGRPFMPNGGFGRMPFPGFHMQSGNFHGGLGRGYGMRPPMMGGWGGPRPYWGAGDMGASSRPFVRPSMIKCTLAVGKKMFIGVSKTKEAAKEIAANKAVHVLRHTMKLLEKRLKLEEKENAKEPVDKKAICLVYEIAAKKSLPVKFELVNMMPNKFSKHFIIKCHVGTEFECQAESSNKKVAKDLCSQPMLDKLKAAFPAEYQSALQGNVMRRLQNKKTKPPSEPPATDPISALMHYRQSRHKRNPEFVLVNQENNARNKEFIIECKIDDVTVQGKGKSKKEAKRNAAQAMVDKLDVPIPPPSTKKPAPTPGSMTSGSTAMTSSNKMNTRPFDRERKHFDNQRTNLEQHRRAPTNLSANTRTSGPIGGGGGANRQGQLPRGIIYAPEATASKQHQGFREQPHAGDTQTQQARMQQHAQYNSPGQQHPTSPYSHTPSNQTGQYGEGAKMLHEGGMPSVRQETQDHQMQFVAAQPPSQYSGDMASMMQQSRHPGFPTHLPREPTSQLMSPDRRTYETSYPGQVGQAVSSPPSHSDYLVTPSHQELQNITPQSIASEMITYRYSPSLNRLGMCVVDEAQRPQVLLSTFCQLFNYTIGFNDVASNKSGHFLAVLAVGTNPGQTVSGTGTSVEAARDMAAEIFLKSMAHLPVQQHDMSRQHMHQVR